MIFSTWFITAQNYTVSEAIGSTFNIPYIVPSILYVVGIYIVIFGGIKKVGKIASYMVPVMCSFYVIGCLIILLKNAAASRIKMVV
jgi:AGCS family alanine or glycine:cation symporter